MKQWKKFFLSVLVPILAGGQVSSKRIEKLREEVDKIVHFNPELEHFNETKTPFYTPPKKVDVKVKKAQQIKYNFEALAILDRSAKLKVMKYKGDELVQVTRDWYKIGESVGPCKLKQVNLEGVLLQCGNKTVAKKLFNFKFQIKVK